MIHIYVSEIGQGADTCVPPYLKRESIFIHRNLSC